MRNSFPKICIVIASAVWPYGILADEVVLKLSTDTAIYDFNEPILLTINVGAENGTGPIIFCHGPASLAGHGGGR